MKVDEDYILEHFGTKGMRWGIRKASSDSNSSGKKPSRKERKAEAKKAKETEIRNFRQSVMKDIGSRSPSELYAVKSKKGPTMIMTGEEFMQKANTGLPFLSIQSTGMKIDDGR